LRKVLVVEDEPMIRLAAIDALEEAGFVVLEAATADDAMNIIDAHTIQFLFTDIQMPGQLSGVELAHVVHQRFPDAGIVVVSGRLTSADIDLPPNAQFVSKPYVFDDIAKRLKALGPRRK
jgi:two-component system cell cycle response regulator CpdR